MFVLKYQMSTGANRAEVDSPKKAVDQFDALAAAGAWNISVTDRRGNLVDISVLRQSVADRQATAR